MLDRCAEDVVLVEDDVALIDRVEDCMLPE